MALVKSARHVETPRNHPNYFKMNLKMCFFNMVKIMCFIYVIIRQRNFIFCTLIIGIGANLRTTLQNMDRVPKIVDIRKLTQEISAEWRCINQKFDNDQKINFIEILSIMLKKIDYKSLTHWLPKFSCLRKMQQIK